MEYSKRTGCATFIVGHVTKDGAIAGPRLLEHLVDTVLYFEGETSGEYRILRAYKNRFGSIDEICVFTMHDAGLREVANPSELFLGSARAAPQRFVRRRVDRRLASGARSKCKRSSARPAYGTPRRLANNLDQQRLAMILAVLGAARRFLARHARRLRVGRRRPARRRTGGRSRHRARDRVVVSQRRDSGGGRGLRRARPLGRGARGRRSRPARSRSAQARLHAGNLAGEHARRRRSNRKRALR